jgi:hypothetical protein
MSGGCQLEPASRVTSERKTPTDLDGVVRRLVLIRHIIRMLGREQVSQEGLDAHVCWSLLVWMGDGRVVVR